MKYMPLGEFKVLLPDNNISNIAVGALAERFHYPLRQTGSFKFHKWVSDLAMSFLKSSRFKDACMTHSPQIRNLRPAPQHPSLSGINK